LPLVLGRTYRFRIEAIGSHVRAFVNGERVIDVIDDAHARGMAGLTMFRARTDYDNVIVTSSPQTVLLADSFNQTEAESLRTWTSSPANAWSLESNNPGVAGVYRQSLLTGTARALNGAPVRDQIVSAIVRPQTFNAAVTNAFVGLMGRHVDDFNHYYVALFRDRAALRKRVNGVHSSLREVPFAVVPGVAYRARLEAIGSSLRLYINDTLITEAQDTTLPTGRYGLITFNAAADFDDFRSVRP
jgi:pectate lyase